VCTTLCNMSDFPAHRVVKQPVLRNSPLKNVVCQMTFPEILGLDSRAVRPIQIALSSKYPTVGRDQEMKLNVGAQGLVPTGEVRPTFSFRDNAGEWSVTLTPDSLALETQAYDDFTDFASRWHDVCREVVETMEISQRDRIGLRYINHIPISPEDDLREIIQTSLLGVAGEPLGGAKKLIRSFQEVVFEQEDGFVTLRHGLLNSEGNDTYVLDFDYFSEIHTPLDLQEQDQTLIDFNHAIFDIFKGSLSKDAFDSFKPEERKDD